jgi:predicted TIM-barrel enzyme
MRQPMRQRLTFRPAPVEFAGIALAFANTGVPLEKVEEQLAVADGAAVGTSFKRDGCIRSEVDPKAAHIR